MVFDATFNNILVISWRSVLSIEEAGVPGENLSQVTDKLDHIILYPVHLIMIGVRIHNFNESNYHMITAMMATYSCRALVNILNLIVGSMEAMFKYMYSVDQYTVINVRT